MSPIYFVPVLKLLDLCITCFTSTACLFLEWFNYKFYCFMQFGIGVENVKYLLAIYSQNVNVILQIW